MRAGFERRVRFPGLRPALCACDPVDPLFSAHRKQVAEVRCIEDELRRDSASRFLVCSSDAAGYSCLTLCDYCNDRRAFHFARRRFGPEADSQFSQFYAGLQHLLQNLSPDFRLVAEPAHPTASGIQRSRREGFGREVSFSAIEFTDSISKFAVAARAPESFDVLLLVRRSDALHGELPAQPIRLLQKNDVCASGASRHRRRDAPGSAADDKDFATQFGVEGIGVGNRRCIEGIWRHMRGFNRHFLVLTSDKGMILSFGGAGRRALPTSAEKAQLAHPPPHPFFALTTSLNESQRYRPT